VFLPLLLLRLTEVEISTSTQLSTFYSFGFTTAGVYSLTVHSSTTAPILFGLLTSETLETIEVDSLNETAVISPIQSLFSDKPATVYGNISSKGVYKIFVYAEVDSATVVISADFANGASRLDYRAAPALIERPIALVLFSVLLTLWLLNWFLNSNLKIYVHYCLTGMYVSAVLARAARLFYIEYTDVHDFSAGAQAVSLLFRVIFQLFLYVVILLCANGWCIVRQRLPLSDLVRAISLAAVFLVAETVLDYADLGSNARIFFLLVMLTSLCLYARELVRSSGLASMYIHMYLLEISNSGIDPESTPIWEKSRMFERLQYCIILYMSLMILQMLVSMFTASVSWVMALMEDIADFGAIVALAVVYRLKGGNRNGFTLVGDDAEMGELVLTDLELVPDAGRTLRKGGTRWEEGMPLPPPPSARQNVVTIETPDGTFEIAARLEAQPTA
jgi:hypothetical protein